MSTGSKNNITIDTVDPIEVFLDIFVQVMDSVDNKVYEFIRTYVEELFDREDRFIDYFIVVTTSEEKAREVVRKFIKYSLPRLVEIIMEFNDVVDARIARLRDMLIREVIDNALSRAFCEVIHS